MGICTIRRKLQFNNNKSVVFSRERRERRERPPAAMAAASSSPVTSASKSSSNNKNEKKEEKKLSTETDTKKKKNQTDSNATQQQQQQPISSSPPPPPPPSSSHKRRKKSEVVVRVIKGSRIYDSKDGKCCHQCRQKTLDFVATCKNLTEIKQCTLHFCHKCMSNRYGEKAEEAVASGDWKCPKCRGICNCSYCMKKRGCAPTGILSRSARATGFSSVSDMLHLTASKSSSSEKKPAVASTRESDVENGSGGKSDSLLQPQPLKINGKGKEARNSKKKRFGSNDDSESVIKEIRDNGAHTVKGGSKNRQNYKDESKKGNVMECRDDNGSQLLNKVKDIVSVVKIPLPQGTQLNTVADVGMPAEDVGHALQFLEFCEAFGKVLNLNRGQPESLLRDLVCGRSKRRMEDSAVVQFHIRLLSVIQKHSGKEYPSSWFQALIKCLSESRYLLKELQSDCFDVGGGGYDELDSSKKLRLLNFLCDEALGTEVLRRCIDEQNSQYIAREKNVKGEVLAAEKIMKKKMQDEVVQAVLAKNGHPLSISEHEGLVSKIKTEVAHTLTQSVEAADTVPKKENRSHAVRSDPIVSDENGRRFWKLSSYSVEMDYLLQDLGEDLVAAEDRWFTYDVAQRTMVESYISSFRKLRK